MRGTSLSFKQSLHHENLSHRAGLTSPELTAAEVSHFREDDVDDDDELYDVSS